MNMFRQSLEKVPTKLSRKIKKYFDTLDMIHRLHLLNHDYKKKYHYKSTRPTLNVVTISNPK